VYHDFLEAAHALGQLAETFALAPLDTQLQPLIEESLKEQGKSTYRQGTRLIPRLLVWLVLVLTLRRDLNYAEALNWMLSGFRWLADLLPAQSKLISDGAISHARAKLGIAVFQTLLSKQVSTFPAAPADFQGWVSVAFDGSTGTMPDTDENREAFGKPSARRGAAAFPQLRLMTLLALGTRRVLDLAWAAYRGKGSGERALVQEIVARTCCQGLLFLLEAGLFGFDGLQYIDDHQGGFIVKAPRHVKPKLLQRLPDGSWLAEMENRVVDAARPATATGRQHWKTVTLDVRLIQVVIPGFRPFWVMTNLRDAAIPARDIAVQYHQRWDIEIAYDEIKTHQCATLRGQSPTTFRSKRPELVQQELYALVISYNAIRTLICQAAAPHAQDPRAISFLETLQHLLDAAPLLTALETEKRETKRGYLLELIATCQLDRPRRPRLNPRVVKVKMSKFARKEADHHGQTREVARDLKIVEIKPGTRLHAQAASGI
jgi:hypothetical protein